MLCFGQLGGQGVFKFLNTSPNARSVAYGGSTLVTWANDLNVGFQNPALLQATMNGQATLNYIHLPAGISAGSTAYAWHKDSVGTFLFGMQYYNYGNFTRADATGEKQGTFSAADYSFQLGYNKHLEHWNFGTNLKFIYSSIESYQSTGIAADFAATYHHSDTSRFVASFLIRNLGYQLSRYAKNQESLPCQIQIGISKQLAHMPFRYFLVANNLQKFNITYIDSNASGTTINLTTNEPNILVPTFPEKLMRHIVFGGEFLFTKNFNIRFGYNYQRRKELILGGDGLSKKGMAGFSWGIGIKVSKFQFSYGGAFFIPGVSNNNFSLVTQLRDWKLKK